LRRRRGTALMLAAALLAGAGATRGRAAEHGAGADLNAITELEQMETRVAALERRLGVAPGSDATGELHTRYEALRLREAEVARRAAEWLRFVPSDAPVQGVITSSFSSARFHPIRRRVQPHLGIDIAAPHGAPVRATADGVVYATAENPTYGLVLDVRHGDSGFLSRYAHLSRIAVHPGQAVRRGDLLGHVGSTGLSTGAHLHYEIFFRGARRDPIAFLPPLPTAGGDG
jgi:murein DD-endopeptidase MepM/ murein hydrolase activator NlpD